MKGARAEERYFLKGILSGCIVKSYASVAGKMTMCGTQRVPGICEPYSDIHQVECYETRSI